MLVKAYPIRLEAPTRWPAQALVQVLAGVLVVVRVVQMVRC